MLKFFLNIVRSLERTVKNAHAEKSYSQQLQMIKLLAKYNWHMHHPYPHPHPHSLLLSRALALSIGQVRPEITNWESSNNLPLPEEPEQHLNLQLRPERKKLENQVWDLSKKRTCVTGSLQTFS